MKKKLIYIVWRRCLGTPQLVSTKDNKMLLYPFSEEEIKIIVVGLHPDKVLGSDVFIAGFYQKCWSFLKTYI